MGQWKAIETVHLFSRFGSTLFVGFERLQWNRPDHFIRYKNKSYFNKKLLFNIYSLVDEQDEISIKEAAEAVVEAMDFKGEVIVRDKFP